MGLIDADKVIERLEKVIKDNPYFVNAAYIRGMQEVIKEQPTAYDIDKVVEQLEEYSNADEAEQLGTIPVIELTDAIEIVKAGYDTKNNPRREAYLKALEDYHDSVQDSCIKWASTFGRRERQLIPYLIKESNTIFQMLKVGASEIE